MRSFTHLIVEAKNKYAYALRPYAFTHDIVGHVDGFTHIRSTYHHFPPIRIKTKPCLFLLKNKSPPTEPDFAFTRRKHEPIPVEDLEQANQPEGVVDDPTNSTSEPEETE